MGLDRASLYVYTPAAPDALLYAAADHLCCILGDVLQEQQAL